MRALRLVGVALATVRIVDTVKEIIPVIPPPSAKSLAVVAVAAGFAYPFAEGDWREHLFLAGSAAGLASMLHDVQSLTRLATDSYIAGITVQARRTTPLGS